MEPALRKPMRPVIPRDESAGAGFGAEGWTNRRGPRGLRRGTGGAIERASASARGGASTAKPTPAVVSKSVITGSCGEEKVQGEVVRASAAHELATKSFVRSRRG